MVVIGVVSFATIARGFASYAQLYTDLPDWVIVAALILALGALAAWGVGKPHGPR